MNRSKQPEGPGEFGYTLDAFREKIERTPEDRINLAREAPGTVVEFTTQNNTYRFTLTDPKKWEGYIVGGERYPLPTLVAINGSKVDQKTSMIMQGVVQAGAVIEIGDPNIKPYLETTHVKTVFIERPKKSE